MSLSLADLELFAAKFVDALPKEPGPEAHVVGLKGELGAGKTAFVQSVARALNITEPVTSPTFVIVAAYQIPHPVFSRLVHIDAYRLTQEDPDTIGWGEYVRDPRNLILVEWPQNLRDFPNDAPILSFSVLDEAHRTVTHEK